MFKVDNGCSELDIPLEAPLASLPIAVGSRANLTLPITQGLPTSQELTAISTLIRTHAAFSVDRKPWCPSILLGDSHIMIPLPRAVTPCFLCAAILSLTWGCAPGCAPISASMRRLIVSSMHRAFPWCFCLSTSRGFISGFYSHSGESVGLGACWCPIVMKRCCNLTYGLVFRAKRLSAVAATRDLHPVPYGVNTWVPFGNGR